MNTAARWLDGYAYPMHERKDAFVQRERMMQRMPSLGKRFREEIHRRNAPDPLGQCHMDFAGTNGGGNRAVGSEGSRHAGLRAGQKMQC